MFPQKSTHFFVKLFFVFLLSYSTILDVKTANTAQSGVREVEATAKSLASKRSGSGVIERIRNFTEYNADVGFEKITHDQIPNGTTGRIKRIDGTYLVCRKVGDEPKASFEKCEASDPDALWTFNRIKDEVLHDWIGIWHPNSDGKYLGVDPKTGHLVFNSKDLRRDSKAIQWEVFGKKITEFLFRNRLTGGVLHQRTDEIEVLKEGEADREETATAQDTVAIGQGDVVMTGVDINYVSLVDCRGQVMFSRPPGQWWQPIIPTDDIGHEYTRCDLTWTHNNQHRTPLTHGLDIRPFFRAVANGGWGTLLCMHAGNNFTLLNSHNWGSWERFYIFNKERFGTDGTVRMGNLVGLHSVVFGKLARRDGGGYVGGGEDAAAYFYVIPAQLTDINTRTNVKSIGPDRRQYPMRGFLEQLAMQDGQTIYGVSHTKYLYKWNGGSWDKISTTFRPRQVSISAKGDLCCVDVDNKLWLKKDDGWVLFAEKVRIAAIRSKAEIWYTDTDGAVNRHNGTSAEKFPLPNGQGSWISTSDSGDVWATDATEHRAIWRFIAKDKNWLQIPGKAYRIAVRTETDVWIVGLDGHSYQYANGGWLRYDAALDIAVASGISVKKIAGLREKKIMTFLSVLDANDTPHAGSPASQLGIEIEKLGMGGGIEPNKSIDFGALPAAQRPRVSGFAVDRIDDFDPASILSLNPMISKGAAWLETSLPKPNIGGVSFQLRVRDAGDAQVVFGQEMSNSFAYKVIFGGWGNTKSAIVKREFKDGDPVDTVVFELPITTYPIAFIPSGNFLPYWVSYNKGLILAGMGDFGANIFLAWRDPNPIPKITRVGFASHKAPVQFNNIKITPPAVFSTVPRIYATSTQKIAPNNNGTITWAEDPFRMNDRGTIQITIQGDKSAAIILARKKNAQAVHYAIIFGDDDNTAITIKKWHAGQRRYNERARIKLDPLPYLKLSKDRRKSYWVSYYFGQIVIGNGDLGKNPLYVFQDLAPVDGVNSIGFANFGDKPLSFGTMRIGSPLALRAEEQEQSYDKTTGPVPFGGGLTIILPFDYEFEQEEQVVKLTDYVLNRSYYLGATPQQGAIYPFQVTIQPNGMPTLDWTRQPENPAKLEIEKAVMRVKNQAELDNIEATRARAQGQIEKDLKLAAGQQKRSKADDLAKGGDMLIKAGTTVMGAAGAAGPIFGGIAIGIGAGIAAGGVGMIVAAGIINATAADKDYEGAELLAVKQRQAAELEANSAKKKQLAEGTANEATVGIRALDSYVFVDKPGVREAAGSQSTSEDAKRNRTEAAATLEEAIKIRPTTLDDMIKLSLKCKDFVMLANQSAVLSGDPTVKQRFLEKSDELVKAYIQAFDDGRIQELTLHQDMLTFLLNAYNNPYLINEFSRDEAKRKDDWYWYVTILGRQLIAKSENNAISINRFFGEYCWLDDTAGFALPEAGSGIVAFEARGTDILVCLAEEKSRIRNSETEVYEICFGGWDNTKVALRLKSLDRYVAAVNKKENPAAVTDPTTFKQYWVSCDNGLINIGCGEPGQGTVLTWQDPYPNRKVKAIGISSWNSQVQYRNILVGRISDVGEIAAAVQAGSSVDESATLEQNIAKLQEIADVFNASEEAEKKKTGGALSPDDLDQLEIMAVDTAIAAFNQRGDGSIVQLQRFKSAVDSIAEDISDADHINAIDSISSALEKDIKSAKSGPKAESPRPSDVKEVSTERPKTDAPIAKTISHTETKDTGISAPPSNVIHQPKEKSALELMEEMGREAAAAA